MTMHAFTDSTTMLRRSLRRMRRYPSLTLFIAGAPVVFLLLFVYVFGGTLGALLLPGPWWTKKRALPQSPRAGERRRSHCPASRKTSGARREASSEGTDGRSVGQRCALTPPEARRSLGRG